MFQIAFDRSIWCLFFEYLMEIFVLLLFSSVFVVCFVVWMWFDVVSCLCEKISSLPCCVLSWTSFLFFQSGVLMNHVFSINVNSFVLHNFSASLYLFKVNSGNPRAMFEICTKLPLKAPEQRHWRCCGFFMINFEQVSQIVLVFPLLPLNK